MKQSISNIMGKGKNIRFCFAFLVVSVLCIVLIISCYISNSDLNNFESDDFTNHIEERSSTPTKLPDGSVVYSWGN